MSLYGDYANAAALVRLLREAGKTVEHVSFTLGENIPDCDMIFFTAGSEKAMLAALEDLLPKRERLQMLLENGTKILATGNSMAMFGSSVVDLQDESIAALDFADYACRILPTRSYSERLLTFAPAQVEVVGVVNSSLDIFKPENPLTSMFTASSAIPFDKTEGYASGNLYTTEQIGPLLVKNPALLHYFAEFLVGEAIPLSTAAWQVHAMEAYKNIRTILEQNSAK